MRAIAFLGGKYTGTHKMARITATKLGCRLIQDTDVIQLAEKRYAVPVSQAEKILYDKKPLTQQLSLKKRKWIAGLKQALAEIAAGEQTVFCGFIGQMIPSNLSFRVWVTAGIPHRTEVAFREDGLSDKKASQQIRKADEALFRWSDYLQKSGDWEVTDFNLQILADNTSSDQAFEMVLQSLDTSEMQTIEEIKRLEDFKLQAHVEQTLTEKGFPVAVRANQRDIEIIIAKPVLFQSRYESRLQQAMADIPEVGAIRIQQGGQAFRTDIWRNYEFRLHPRMLYQQMEDSFSKIYEELTTNNPATFERKAEVQQRLWT